MQPAVGHGVGASEDVAGVPGYEREGDQQPEEDDGVWGVVPFRGTAAPGARQGLGGGEVGGWEFGFVGACGYHGGGEVSRATAMTGIGKSGCCCGFN